MQYFRSTLVTLFLKIFESIRFYPQYSDLCPVFELVVPLFFQDLHQNRKSFFRCFFIFGIAELERSHVFDDSVRTREPPLDLFDIGFFTLLIKLE